MIEAVFISDLHLHPGDTDIQNRFNAFIRWASVSVKKVYILGDFFYAWAGDDSIDEWSRAIAAQLMGLKNQGISLYYLHGNRDFLLGKTFAQLAGWEILSDPTVIELGSEQILLSHGDRYCTKDLAHQRFMKLTRNRLFKALFLSLPLSLRNRLVNKVRTMSLENQNKSKEEMDVVAEAVIKHMSRHKINTLIHGHTHKPSITTYTSYSHKLVRYVLSDWDDRAMILCYDNTKGIYFAHSDIFGESQ